MKSCKKYTIKFVLNKQIKGPHPIRVLCRTAKSLIQRGVKLGEKIIGHVYRQAMHANDCSDVKAMST